MTPTVDQLESTVSPAAAASEFIELSAPKVPETDQLSDDFVPPYVNGLSHKQAENLLMVFFDHLYPVPSYSFVHPESIMARFRDKAIDLSLLLSLCAVTAQRLTGASDDHPKWIHTAEEEIWTHLESPTVSRFQALLLIVIYQMEAGGFQRAFMLAGLAGRAASAMRLNHERADVDAISAEARRRTVWCFKLIESYISIGLTEFELCPFECIYLQPPLGEEDFILASSHAPADAGISASDADAEGGRLSYCVKLAAVRRDIIKLTRELRVCDEPFPQLTRISRSLERELWQLQPETLTLENGELSSQGLARLTESRWLPRHMMMIASWHQGFCDLFRLLLPDFPDAPPHCVLGTLHKDQIEQAERVCVEHASSIINLLCDLNQRCTQMRILELDTAICGYHATRLMLFIAQFGKSPELPTLEFALSRAELCLAAIKRFFRPSALAQPILEDMKRMIDGYSSQDSDIIALTWSDRMENPGDPALHLSPAARARERLAIHSLLRQAEFSDDNASSPTSSSSSFTMHYEN